MPIIRNAITGSKTTAVSAVILMRLADDRELSFLSTFGQPTNPESQKCVILQKKPN